MPDAGDDVKQEAAATRRRGRARMSRRSRRRHRQTPGPGHEQACRRGPQPLAPPRRGKDAMLANRRTGGKRAHHREPDEAAGQGERGDDQPHEQNRMAGVDQRALTAPNQRGSEPWLVSAKVTREVEVIAPQVFPATEASAVAVRMSAPAGRSGPRRRRRAGRRALRPPASPRHKRAGSGNRARPSGDGGDERARDGPPGIGGLLAGTTEFSKPMKA